MPGTETARGWPLEAALGLVLGVINLVVAVIFAFLLYTISPAALAPGRWFLPLLLAGEFAAGIVLRMEGRTFAGRLLLWATLVSALLIAVVAVVVLSLGAPLRRL